MEEQSPVVKKLPRYVKYFYVLASVVLTVYVITILRPIVNPLLLAFFIAVLLEPISTFLEKLYIPRVISAFITTLLFVILILTVASFFLYQITNISSELPSYNVAFSRLFVNLQKSILGFLGFTTFEFLNFLHSSVEAFLRTSTQYFSGILSGTANVISYLLFFMISLFFFLYYRRMFVVFIYKLFFYSSQNLDDTLDKINQTILQYIVGLFIIIFIVATLNTIGLYILGVNYAIFFGVLAAVLTIIPYIGIITGSLIPGLYVLLVHGSMGYALSVVLLFFGIQILEGNLITPNIIGSRVNVNPFAAILALFFGGMLLGATGIILALPMLGVFKIIIDEVPSLQPLSYLIGNPKKSHDFFKKIFNFIRRKNK